jgi:hypothetical protein
MGSRARDRFKIGKKQEAIDSPLSPSHILRSQRVSDQVADIQNRRCALVGAHGAFHEVERAVFVYQVGRKRRAASGAASMPGPTLHLWVESSYNAAIGMGDIKEVEGLSDGE